MTEISFDSDDDARNMMEVADSVLPGLRRQQKILRRVYRLLEAIEVKDKNFHGYEVGSSGALDDAIHDNEKQITRWEETKVAAEDELGQSADDRKYGTMEEQARRDYLSNVI